MGIRETLNNISLLTVKTNQMLTTKTVPDKTKIEMKCSNNLPTDF